MATKKRKTGGEEDTRRYILVVDDEPAVRELLQIHLTEHGYHVTTAATGAEALRIANHQPIHIIVSDLILADTDGIELLKRLKKSRPRLPVIMMSGYSDADPMIHKAKEAGAYAWVSKTNPLSEILKNIQSALKGLPPETAETAETEPESESPSGQEAKDELEPASSGEQASAAPSSSPADETSREPTGVRTEESAAPAQVLPDKDAPVIAVRINVTPGSERFDFGLEIFSRMLSAYHPNLGNTAMRAVAICKALGESLNLPSADRQSLLWASALHDIGLVRLERRFVTQWLQNPEKLDEKELTLFKRHPERSAQMLEFCPVFKGASEIILAHHEAWDGSGFPSKLKMEMIPWLSRLLSVAIFYCGDDHPSQKTIARMNAQADKTFDPRAIEAVTKVLPSVSLPRGERELMAFELKPGMVLAEDVCDWDGIVIAGRGTELTGATASKISHLSAAGETDSRILIIA